MQPPTITVQLSPQDFDALRAFLTRVPYGLTEAHALQAIGAALNAGLQQAQADAAAAPGDSTDGSDPTQAAV